MKLTALVDRSVYPMDSVIYARADIPKLLKNQKINFKLLDANKKLLAEKDIDPKYSNSTLKNSKTYECVFKMNGPDWTVGNYILKVTYGKQYSTDQFSINQEPPYIRADKSIYVIGNKIIVTIIDPNADKDSNKIEYIGDTKESKLIIKSKFGKIDGYRLRETDKSTAVFQGMIGVLGAKKDGTIIPQKFNRKIIDKIQGTRWNDGFIAGSCNDKITIVYKNRTETIQTTVYISNYNVQIETDKNKYQPNETVEIRLVAPDYIVDYDSQNKIGHNSLGHVEISTDIDTLSGCEFVESDLDSGVFIKNIKLVNANQKNKSKNMIKCKDSDTIKIIFTRFDGKKAHCKASIKSHKNSMEKLVIQNKA